MAYKCLFMDNDIYTAQDVNDAISNIVSGGVSGYPFGSSAMADLNTAIAELANGGVNYRGTDCLVVNDGDTYKISEGACIMNDGSQIIFDYDGYELEVQEGVLQYVYLERDVLHNRINVVVSEEAGGNGTIPLAEITANGAVLDRRRFASAKISIAGEPQNMSVKKHIATTGLVISPGTSFDIDTGFNGWKYVIFADGSSVYGNSCIEIPDGSSAVGFPTRNIDGSREQFITVTRNGSVLHFENSSSSNARGINIEIEVR